MGIPKRPAQRTTIDELADVDLLVRRFYQAVIPDPTLGPIFAAFRVDGSVHVPKLVDFWAGRLLGRSGYDGNPAGAHLPVHERCPFGGPELARWLELWEETVDELFVGDVAELAKARAHGAADAIATLLRRADGTG